MKKNIVLFTILCLFVLCSKGQTYHPDDKEGLRMFLRQPSAISGQLNAQRLGLTLTDTLNWQSNETWVSKVIGLVWNESAPKRIYRIGSQFNYKWRDRGLAGNLNCGYWTELTWLFCNYNQITSLELSNNIKLVLLDCEHNPLTALDVSNNVALYDIIANNTQLTTIDVSNNTQLVWLMLNYNQLTNLDVSKNTSLGVLTCAYNQLTTLDVRNNIALIQLGIPGNQLTDIDLKNNTALQAINVSNNQIKELDLSHLYSLNYLFCDSNQLTTLDVTYNALEFLHCQHNQLKTLKGIKLFTNDCIATHNQLLFSQYALSPRPFQFFPQNTIQGGDIYYFDSIDLGTEYFVKGYFTQFRWFDITDGNEQALELEGTSGIFYLTEDMVGKRLRCKMTNQFFTCEDFCLVYEVTVRGNKNIITASAGNNGTIDPSGDVLVEHGENQTFIFTPKENYVVDSLWVDDIFTPHTTQSYTFENVTSNHTIHVTFLPNFSIIDYDSEMNIKIFPNPTTGQLIIENYEFEITNIEIFDVFGRKLLPFASKIFPQHTLDISHISSGIYFVKITTEQGETVKKLVKQ